MKEYEYYIFDFDGTLVDSSEGIYNSIIYALKEFGIEENDREKLRYFIGPPLFHSFKHIYGVNDEESNWLVAKYRERYKVKGCAESIVYSGVPEMLKALKEKGKKIAIASSKWFAIDTESKKIRKLTPEITEAYGEPVTKCVFENAFNEKIKVPEDLKLNFNFEIQRRDIDTNGHVNNLNYIVYVLLLQFDNLIY